MNLGYLVTRSAQLWADRIALKDEAGSRTYQSLDKRSNQLARFLQQAGVEQGERVAVLAWNCNEIVEAEVAIYKAGFVRVPINARLSDQEVVHVCNDSGVKVLITDQAHESAARLALAESASVQQLLIMKSEHETEGLEFVLKTVSDDTVCVDVQLDDVAVNHYTSGSSGVLKAAMQTVRNRWALVQKMTFRSRLHPDQQEHFVHVGPITHASGMSILPLLAQGHRNIILSRFDVDTYLSTLEQEKATQTYLVPTMINRILASDTKQNYDISHLNMLRYGAAPISPKRLKEAVEFFGPILNQGYGAGETCSSVTMLTEADHASMLQDHPERLASCGRPLFNTEVSIMDDDGNLCGTHELGELVIRGQDVMAGYWNAPDLTAAALKDGYYHTGDVAYRDEDGYLFIVDRKKDMIVTGGFNVYPTEVEKALFEHLSIFEACVVGVPDEDMGEAVMAVVVLKEGETVSAQELIDHCAAHLGKFKKPHQVEFVKELPKNGNGKIVRREVRDAYWKDAERRV